MRSNVFDTLQERGFINQVSDPQLAEILGKQRITTYCGFDPTAPSLHLGHMVPVMALVHMRQAGHRVIAVVGGATGQVGDPSGKDRERDLMPVEVLETNIHALHDQLTHLLGNVDGPEFVLLNNHDWISPFSYLGFLRDVGKHFSVNAMVAKESVRRRLEEREQGISYTEFSYQLIQAYDFYHLHQEWDCTLQIGGSDQWGNVTAGIDLTRRLTGNQVYGITFPLITTASGQKFGKSEGNAIWVDPRLTSPYHFYQYWMQTADEDVDRFLKLYTLLDLEEIEEIVAETRANPERRIGQKQLATHATRLAMGQHALQAAEKATQILFGEEPIEACDESILLSIFGDAPSHEIPRSRLHDGLPLLGALCETGSLPSRSEARRRIEAGGVYLNNRRVCDPNTVLTADSLASPSVLVLRLGKKQYHLIRFTEG
ncbi:MAG: tyrosine--tRNA ligase [Bradymonadales bacterium]|nr:tyrosine--tRNA ligase [Bradymonadales bacterium]